MDDGEASADDPRRLTERCKLLIVVIGAPLITLGIFGIIHLLAYFLQFRSPDFQVDSVSISVDNNNVAKWDISFSLSNPNPATLHYRKIEVSVGGRRPLNSTTARISPMFKLGFHRQSSRNATVYVALPSPRPPLIVDGSEFAIRFLSEYDCTAGKKKKGTAVAVCGDNRDRFWTSNGVVAMVVGPMPCY